MFRDRYLPYLIVLITLCADPFIWYIAFGLNDRIMSVFLISISFLFLAKKKVYMGPKDYLWFGSWIMVFLYINIHGTFLMDTTQIVQSYGYLFKMFSLFVVIYALKKDFSKLLNLFFQYNIFFMYASVLLFFLLLFGIELPSIEFTRSGSWNSFLYPLGIVMDWTQFGNAKIIRISGLTDEPGQLALLILWFMILNEFTLKSSRYRKSLIFCGIFTFSLGFLFSLALFGIYFLFIKINRPILIIKSMAILLSIIIVTYMTVGEDVKSYLNNRIFARILLTPESRKMMAGDNRSEEIIREYKELKSINRLWFGVGITEAQRRNLNVPFSHFGFISYITLYFPIFLLLVKKSNDIRILLLLIIVINFLQRPGIHFMYQMVCLTFIYYAPTLRLDSFKRKSLLLP